MARKTAKQRLAEYERKRSFEGTPEPGSGGEADGEGGNRFVIQEHSATRLHWDLRLEHEGVLQSWALPRGLPHDPDTNRLAVHTEDHPLDYIDFHGEIPKGNYGAGSMKIVDTGTYEAEEREENKLKVVIDGSTPATSGRFAMFQTRGRDWMIHRMDGAEEGWQALPDPDGFEPMAPTERQRPPQDDDAYAYEISFGGLPTLAFADSGHLDVRVAGEDVVGRFPELRDLLRQFGIRDALFAGEIAMLDPDTGRHDPDRLAWRLEDRSDSTRRKRSRSHPVTFVLGDLLHLEGEPLLELPFAERRERLEGLELEGVAWRTGSIHVGDGAALLAAAKSQGLPAILARRLDAPYEPGACGKALLRLAAEA